MGAEIRSGGVEWQLAPLLCESQQWLGATRQIRTSGLMTVSGDGTGASPHGQHARVARDRHTAEALSEGASRFSGGCVL